MKRKISKIAFLSILSIIMLMTFTAPTMLPGDNNKASAENNVYVRTCGIFDRLSDFDNFSH